jgi:hypothetical protein
MQVLNIEQLMLAIPFPHIKQDLIFFPNLVSSNFSKAFERTVVPFQTAKIGAKWRHFSRTR